MRIGIDLGGTKIEVLALDDVGSELIRKRRPTPTGDYAGTLDVIAELVAFVEAKIGRKGSVGVAAPGAISPASGLVKNANSTVLNGKALDRDLAAKLGRPIKIENDANCFALSEASDGAGAGASVVFGVILGTGVGGGLVVDGRLVSGRNRIAGEWGHNPLPFARDDERPGPLCYCGKSGCIETFLSGPGFARDHFARTGAALTAREIAAAAAAGEAEAGRSLALYRDRLARGLAGLINIVDPDVIAFGGGLSNIDSLYIGLPELMGRYAFSDRIATETRRAVHGDSSGVRGAAWLWPIAPC
ncbi:ROK family protein [Methylocella silvestris]|uniref:Fructokinase n=1 Tax=Methylocella silvestris TaxID=199596 RepID=A0A2J7TEG1_METSI|nr:ROK family protein [Methylocella silvestris]PNG25150.1 fructokinase [Methylocella silvestris]